MKRSIRSLPQLEASHVWEMHSAELVCLCLSGAPSFALVALVSRRQNGPVKQQQKVSSTNTYENFSAFNIIKLKFVTLKNLP